MVIMNDDLWSKIVDYLYGTDEVLTQRMDNEVHEVETKLYEITLNECMAEDVMVYLSEGCEHDTPLVDKFAEVVNIIPCDCDSVTIKVTADEMAEVLNAITALENLA